MTDIKDYLLIETQTDVSRLNDTTILACYACHFLPDYKQYENTELPPSLSRRYSLYCPRCTKHPLSMFTLEGMIGYWNRVRK